LSRQQLLGLGRFKRAAGGRFAEREAAALSSARAAEALPVQA
jgi:hypothetical protein